MRLTRKLRSPRTSAAGRAIVNAVLVSVLASFIVFAGKNSWAWIERRNDPRPLSPSQAAMVHEAAMLQSLRPGGREQDLERLLGQPASLVASEGQFRRTVFVLKDSAVLAVSDSSGRVLLTAVTSLRTSFRPTFEMDDGSRLTLWKSHVAEVQEVPDLAVGFAGANFAYYFEWTPGPSHATNYRRGLYGYALLSNDPLDTGLNVFYPFWYAADRQPGDREAIDMGLPDSAEDFRIAALNRWLALPEAQTFRDALPINTVAFQAQNVEALPVFPTVTDSEVWPYFRARAAQN